MIPRKQSAAGKFEFESFESQIEDVFLQKVRILKGSGVSINLSLKLWGYWQNRASWWERSLDIHKIDQHHTTVYTF